MARLLMTYWGCHRIVPKMGKFVGKDFHTERLVMQGYPASPMIFNIVVDVVVREFLDVV